MKFARPALTAALAVTLFSACGGASDTHTADPGSTGTTLSATPTPTPQPWTVKSKAGAEAFGEYWVDRLYLAQQGDTDPFSQLNQGCDLCDSMVEQLNDVYSAGGNVTGKPYRNVESSVQQGGKPDHMTVLVEYSPGKATWVREQDGTAERSTGALVRQLLEVRWISGRWLAVQVIDFAGV